MKSSNYYFTLILSLILGQTFAPVTLKGVDTVIDTFDTEVTVSVWTPTWGTAPVLTWDAQDAARATNSGSLRVSADYFTPADNGWEQMVITRTFETPLVGSEFASVSVNVKVDPSSVRTTGGNYGYFELKRTDATAIGGVNLTSTNWTNITFNLAATEGTLNGIIIQNGNGGFQGPITYYLDNFVFTRRTGGTKPPALAIAPNTTPGLKVYASAPGQAYQRQNIVYVPSEVLANNLWWVNQPQPITYSITWADFPNPAAYAGFQGHIMLPTDTGGGITPDWNDPNVIMIEFQYANTPGPDGTNGTPDDRVLARARFLHKVNEASANGMLYRGPNTNGLPVGVLGEAFAPSMIGTWSVSFRNNTNITLTASDNSTLDLTMPDADFPLYEPVTKGVSALFGVQPNADTRVGLSATISRIKITKGSTVVVDDPFQTAQLDPAKWIVRAQDPGGIFTAPPDVALFISWDLPDTGFSLKASSVLTGPWSAYGTPMPVGARKLVLVGKTALPGQNSGFFRLTNP